MSQNHQILNTIVLTANWRSQLKIQCYFNGCQETKKDMRIHAIDPRQEPEYTMCGMDFEEWDCGENFKKRITDKPITCKDCINVLENLQIFKKTENGWI